MKGVENLCKAVGEKTADKFDNENNSIESKGDVETLFNFPVFISRGVIVCLNGWLSSDIILS
jgi:hypothetical protein